MKLPTLGSARFNDTDPVVSFMSLVEDTGIVRPMTGRAYDFNEALNKKMMVLPDKVIDALVIITVAAALLSGKFGI